MGPTTTVTQGSTTTAGPTTTVTQGPTTTAAPTTTGPTTTAGPTTTVTQGPTTSVTQGPTTTAGSTTTSQSGYCKETLVECPVCDPQATVRHIVMNRVKRQDSGTTASTAGILPFRMVTVTTEATTTA